MWHKPRNYSSAMQRKILSSHLENCERGLRKIFVVAVFLSSGACVLLQPFVDLFPRPP